MNLSRHSLILIVTYFLSGLAIAAKNEAEPKEFSRAASIATQKVSVALDPAVKPRDDMGVKPRDDMGVKPRNDMDLSRDNFNLNVVVSIPPFYAIVSEIMQGVGKPKLLLTSGGSSHHAVLSPSQLKSLEEANLIFWGGPDLETFLIRPLETLNTQKTKIVELDKAPNLHWLDTRFSANYNDETETSETEHDAHEHDHGDGNDHDHHAHDHSHHAHVHGPKDMHFWLDPDNGVALIDYITANLNEAYPEGRSQFEKNAATLKRNLKALDKSLKAQLRPIQNKPYLVLHDGYQYFEKHYGLNAVGAITHHPELPIGVARMQKIRDIIEQDKVECVFTEPGVSPKLTESLAQEYHLRTGVLDPMERPEKGDYRYEHLFQGLSESLLKCLKPETSE